MYSCRLGSEQDTALSIIDPVNVQVELCGSPTYQSSSGLLDAFNMEDFPPLLEVKTIPTNSYMVYTFPNQPTFILSKIFLLRLMPSQIQFPALDIRLSYNDVQLFLAIAKSIPTGSPSVTDAAYVSPAAQSFPNPETATKPKDSFRHQTEVLLGTKLKKCVWLCIEILVVIQKCLGIVSVHLLK